MHLLQFIEHLQNLHYIYIFFNIKKFSSSWQIADMLKAYRKKAEAFITPSLTIKEKKTVKKISPIEMLLINLVIPWIFFFFFPSLPPPFFFNFQIEIQLLTILLSVKFVQHQITILKISVFQVKENQYYLDKVY